MLRARGFHLPDEKTNTAPMANAAGILKRGSHCRTRMSDDFHVSQACDAGHVLVFFVFFKRNKNQSESTAQQQD